MAESPSDPFDVSVELGGSQDPSVSVQLDGVGVRCCFGMSSPLVDKIVSTSLGDTVNLEVSGLVVAQHL